MRLSQTLDPAQYTDTKKIARVFGGGGFVRNISPGGDFTLARSEVVVDSGGNPLEGIRVESCGFQDRTEKVVYESRGDYSGMKYGDLVARHDRIEGLIQEIEEKRENFSPTLTLLLEKSNQNLSVVTGRLWRDFWAVVEQLKKIRGGMASRAPRGSRGITSHGRRMVRSACTLLERKYGKACLVFFTATIPQLPDDEMRTISAKFSECVRQFRQSWQREAVKRGLDPEMVHVVELQDKRFAATGYAVPHLHAVFQGRTDSRSMWAIWVQKFDELWERAVSAVLGRSIKMPAACNTKQVRKSAANYLGKYCSKGSASVKRVAKWGKKMPLPTSWYGVTNALRADIAKATIGDRVHGCWDTFARALDTCPFPVWWKEFVLPESGRTVAMYGRIPPDRITDFRLWLDSASEQFLERENISLQLSG
jgi:hypothetical protein